MGVHICHNDRSLSRFFSYRGCIPPFNKRGGHPRRLLCSLFPQLLNPTFRLRRHIRPSLLITSRPFPQTLSQIQHNLPATTLPSMTTRNNKPISIRQPALLRLIMIVPPCTHTRRLCSWRHYRFEFQDRCRGSLTQ